MLGPTEYASARCIDTLSSFLLFLDPIEKIIVDMTNLYGERRYQKNWKYVDVSTMRAFYGLMLLAGVYRSHGEIVTELWDNRNGRPIFRATMSLRRFQTITQCLCFDDKELRRGLGTGDKLAPIRNVFDKWSDNLKILYHILLENS